MLSLTLKPYYDSFCEDCDLYTIVDRMYKDKDDVVKCIHHEACCRMWMKFVDTDEYENQS